MKLLQIRWDQLTLVRLVSLGGVFHSRLTTLTAPRRRPYGAFRYHLLRHPARRACNARMLTKSGLLASSSKGLVTGGFDVVIEVFADVHGLKNMASPTCGVRIQCAHVDLPSNAVG